MQVTKPGHGRWVAFDKDEFGNLFESSTADKSLLKDAKLRPRL